MKVLLDSNILIAREDPKELSPKLAEILQLSGKRDTFSIWIHPACYDDINQDKNESRKSITLSKLAAYPTLEPSSEVTDEYFQVVGQPKNDNDKRDDAILFALCVGDVSSLITNDSGIHKKAKKLNLEQSVFNINEALSYIRKLFTPSQVSMPTPLREMKVSDINVNDVFFNSLKKEYTGFLDWWEKISKADRTAITYFEQDNIKAILMVDIQDQTIFLKDTPLPKKFRLKICTFKVASTGLKIGELFIKKSISIALDKQLDEIFLTHFTKEDDYLIELISEYGFEKVGEKNDGESVYIKKVKPIRGKDLPTSNVEFSKQFYPYFLDGSGISKFMIPIQPKYHERLFPEYQEKRLIQLELFSNSKMKPEGNTIKKAYVCGSPSKQMKPGDIVIFYLSQTDKVATVLGIVESVFHDAKEPDALYRHIGKRTVYSIEELKQKAQGKVLTILFLELHHLSNKLNISYMIKNDIVKRAPQSIMRLKEEAYQKIKRSGLKNGHFAFN